MIENLNLLAALNTPATRRQLISGAVAAIGGLKAASKLVTGTQQQGVKEVPATAGNENRTSLHQEVELKGEPQRVYDALLDPKQFAAFTEMPAQIDPKAGGAFSMFSGMIVGRNIELVLNQRIVQAWRPTHWAPGVYSIVKFGLKAQPPGTFLVLDHTGFPEGEYDSLFKGWNSHYWDPLKKSLG